MSLVAVNMFDVPTSMTSLAHKSCLSWPGASRCMCILLHRHNDISAEAFTPGRKRLALRHPEDVQVAIECDGICHYSCNRPLVDGRQHHM